MTAIESRPPAPDGAGLYDARPELYDIHHEETDEDLPFLAALAQQASGPVLELGCGTGRVLGALEAAGGRRSRQAFVGLDRSAAMLRRAEERLRPRGNMQLVAGDLRTFAVTGGPFALIICGLNTFMELLTPEDQLACLERCAAHLAADGVLVIDLLNPYDALGEAYRGQLIHQFTRQLADGSFVSLASSSLTDGSAQHIETYRQFDEWGAGRPVSRSAYSLTTRFTYRYEMEHLLARAGLPLQETYGDYEESPWAEDAARLIVLAGTRGTRVRVAPAATDCAAGSRARAAPS